MSDSFAHLHVHTEFSMLDGAAKVDDLFAEAARQGMPALAMTDHGYPFGAYDFWKAGRKHGIKAIVGVEAYVTPRTHRSDKTRIKWGNAQTRPGDDVSGSGAYTHMTLLSETTEGMHNLFKMSSLASLEGFYYKPRMDREILNTYAKGLIATTGCPSGEIQTRLRLGQYDLAVEAAAEFRDIFGKDNFFCELMDHGLGIERQVQADLLKLAKDLGLPLVATNDLHYTKQSDSVAHEALLCVQSGSTLDDPKRFKFDATDFYLKTAEEMRTLWRDYPEACDNTLLIAERCDVSFEEQEGKYMPKFPTPEGVTDVELFTREVWDGLDRRYPNGITDEVRKRAEYEIEVVSSKGYSSYFLVVADFINWARAQGIRVGPGRGSGAGSLAAYAMRITELDPLEHGLIFERFLNPERMSMPDFDVDFDDRRRGEVIQYVVKKYGSDHVAQIVTYGTIKAKQAVKDASRVLGYPFSMGDKINKTLPPPVMGKDMPLTGVFDTSHKRYGEAGEMRELYQQDPEIRKVVDLARGLEGLKRQWGVHAAGVIMSSAPLADHIPLMKREADGAIITQFDYPSCEALGMVKMDFLGLKTLTIIDDAVAEVKRNRGVDIVVEDLSLSDEKTYQMMREGHTIGVFQLEGAPMRSLMRAIAPDTFGDVSALIALYRPGPMGVGAHLEFAERKNGRKPVEPIHPEFAESLADILAESRGIIAYQEQVQFIAQRVAGYSLGRADSLRRAMGKKKREVLDAEYVPFRDGAKKNGYSDAAIKVLWDTLVPFADYAFNKSHSAAYGVISYWTAYLKAHYPVEYMAAVLSSERADKDKTAYYLQECRRMGIKVLPPDVNESNFAFSAVGDDIRFGLGSVRKVGVPVVEAVVAARDGKGRFVSFQDYTRKVGAAGCKKDVVEWLIKAGAFDSLGHARRGLSLAAEDILAGSSTNRKQEAKGQFDLFSAMGQDFVQDAPISGEEWDKRDMLALEREALGRYVSAHPLDGVDLSHEATTPIAFLASPEVPDRAQVVLAGVISSVVRKQSRKGTFYAEVVLEDLSGAVDMRFFSQAYQRYGAQLVEDAIVVVAGEVDKGDEGSVQVLGSGVRDVRPGQKKSFDPMDYEAMVVVLSLEAGDVPPGLLQNFKQVMESAPGPLPVVMQTPSGLRYETRYTTNGKGPVRLQAMGLTFMHEGESARLVQKIEFPEKGTNLEPLIRVKRQ